MPKLTFLPHKDLCPDGLEIDADEGMSICDIALKNNIEIRGIKLYSHLIKWIFEYIFNI